MRLLSHETGFDLAHSLNPARYRDNAPRLDGMVRRECGALGTLAFGVGP
jgi:hypothetical protein